MFKSNTTGYLDKSIGALKLELSNEQEMSHVGLLLKI
jgi:hypothetical protein